MTTHLQRTVWAGYVVVQLAKQLDVHLAAAAGGADFKTGSDWDAFRTDLLSDLERIA